MNTISIIFLRWLLKNYPNDADLGSELRKRLEFFDFSMDKDDKKSN